MTRKFLAFSFVMLLCMMSFSFLLIDGSSDADTTGTLRPSYYSSEDNKVWYSGISREFTSSDYDNVHIYHNTWGVNSFDESYRYYDTDPSENVKKFAEGEADLNEGKKLDELAAGVSYWAVRADNHSYSSVWEWKSAIIKDDMIYFPAGKYTIEVSSSNMDGTRSYFDSDSSYSNRAYIEDGKGTVTLNVSMPSTYRVCVSSSGSSNDSFARLMWKMDYKITPSLPEQRTVECEDKETITTNVYWMQYVTKKTFEPGLYYISASSNSVAFATGSSEESYFIENILNKGSTDISGYINPTALTLTSASKISVYTLARVTDSLRSEVYISKDGGNGDDYECEITEHKAETYKFYAGQSFSIAVSYDTSKYSYVILKSNLCAIYLESGKVYDLKLKSATEYELYGVIKDSSVSIAPFEVGIYTEKVPEADNNGLIFAGVSIGFCVIAFFLLFFYGRRTKWKDDTGLPSGGTGEIVHNDIPAEEEVTEETEKASDE